jgi:hypothetical protein
MTYNLEGGFILRMVVDSTEAWAQGDSYSKWLLIQQRHVEHEHTNKALDPSFQPLQDNSKLKTIPHLDRSQDYATDW